MGFTCSCVKKKEENEDLEMEDSKLKELSKKYLKKNTY